MCGIAAIFAFDNSAPGVDKDELLVIRDYLARRGPDGAGLWLDPERRVGLGHRRLSIIDVSEAGAQPMLLEERKLAIIFNGEIYNYRELRADLEARGCRFRSQCDTEVLLHLYATEGEAMLGKLRGMFAFAIWSGETQSLFLARDPFGIKPLYWSTQEGTFRMASQVKALLAGGQMDTSPCPAGHVGFFLWGHVPAPYTLYRGIHNLPAGHCLRVGIDGKINLRAYCDLTSVISEAKEGPNKENPHSQAAHGELRRIMSDSVRHHLISDVPVGVFLSSGIDSTTLAALASESDTELRTVTLGFEEYKGTINDETPLAEEVARHYGARHQTIWVSRKDFENDLHRLLHAMDQPTSDGVNSYFISKAASQAGLKVALSGLGGDELFGGYPSFTELPLAATMLSPFREMRTLGRGLRAISAPVLKRMTSPKYAGVVEYGGTYAGSYLLRRGMFMPWELSEFLDADMVREGWKELHTLERLNQTIRGIHSPHLKVSALELSWYMRNQLLQDTDWASMEHSLEVRVPLVDLEVLRALAPSFTRKPYPTKHDLAQTPLKPLPACILNRPKTGFQVPVRQWLLLENQKSQIADRKSSQRGLRGWAREVYSSFTHNLENHRVSLRSRTKVARAVGEKAGTCSSSKAIRVFMLLTDGFGGLGGISKFNRDFLQALCSDEQVEEVLALPRLMPDAPGLLPPKLTHVTSGLGGKSRYIRSVLPAAKQFQSNNKSGARQIIICGHINLLPAALLARRICKCDLYLIIHGVDAWKPTPSRLANACIGQIDGFISVSHLTKRRFMRWTHLRDDQGIVLPNCVDLSIFTPGAKSQALLTRYQLQGKKVIMTLGRLASEERYKGFDEVMEAMPILMEEIPDLHYLICGDGKDRHRLERKAVRLGIRNRVVFAGMISDEEKVDHYRISDVYVMPSSGEGFGIVYLEALACGIPVIGSKTDGSREALLNGQLGTLVDPRDRAELVSAIRNILVSDDKKPASMPGAPTVDYFSTAQFERRVHDILGCIAGGR